MNKPLVTPSFDELAAASEVLDTLSAKGVVVEAVDGRIRLSPPSAVDTALRDRVSAQKPAILFLLAARPDPTAVWRLALEKVAESIDFPPDVLAAAREATVRWVPVTRLKDP